MESTREAQNSQAGEIEFAYATVQEASAALRMSDRTVQRLFKKGVIPGRQIGKRILVEKRYLAGANDANVL